MVLISQLKLVSIREALVLLCFVLLACEKVLSLKKWHGMGTTATEQPLPYMVALAGPAPTDPLS